MGGFDVGGAIEGGVEGVEAENLGFGTAGGGAVSVLAALAQGRIAILPQLAGGLSKLVNQAVTVDRHFVEDAQSSFGVSGLSRDLCDV